MNDPPHRLSASEAAARIAAGSLTSSALVRSCLDRIAEREPDVAAWAYLDPEQALAAARRADAAGSGCLLGVPVGFKDIVDTADMPTGYGSPIYRGHRPFADAVCVAATRRAGGVALGKTVSTEFASRYPGPTRNPRNPAHTPGGSSSGSAAAVADEMVPLAIGTQTAGSVIRPAAYCGIVGYKPTFGLLSFAGVRHLAESVDTLGCMARTLEDVALFRAALLGVDAVGIEPLAAAPRIGLARTHHWEEAQPATRTLLEEAATRLARCGAKVDDFTLPPGFEDSAGVHQRITRFEARNCFAHDLASHPENLSRAAHASIEAGREVGYPRYLADLRAADAMRLALEAALAEVDVLLTPSAVGEPPAGLSDTGPVQFNYLWTMMHTPAVTVPAFTGPGGLPVGAQVVGRRWDDDRMLACAAWIHRHIG